MPTIIEKTIGTGGDYADWDAFLAAAPSNLVTLDQQWRVKFKKQIFTRASTFVFANKTTDATRYFEFTSDTGAAWFEAAGIRALPFMLDASRGATLQTTGGVYGFHCQVRHTRINNLQIICASSANNAGPSIFIESTNSDCLVERCIFDAYGNNGAILAAAAISGPHTVKNCLIVHRGASPASSIALFSGGVKVVNTLCVALNVRVDVGVRTAYQTSQFTNLGVFNAALPEVAASPANKTTCATDSATSGWLNVPFSTATFTSISPGSPDFRLPDGSALIDAGSATGDVTTDATGQARPYGAAYDIGPWEYAVPDNTAPTLTSPTGSASSSTSASGTVVTNEAGGTLFYLVSTASSATAAQVKAGQSKSVTSAGSQSASTSALNQQTAYRFHFLHRDGAGNDSAVATSAQFNTPATPVGDTVAPVLSSPTGAASGPTTGYGSIVTNEAGGLLYGLASTAASGVNAATVKAGASQSVDATGSHQMLFTGLAPLTPYYAYYVQEDSSGNTSAVVRSAMFTTQGASTEGTFSADFPLSWEIQAAPVEPSDTTPPTHSGTITIVTGTDSATLSWPAASDNIAVAGYEYSIDGGATYTSTGTARTVTRTGLTPATPYSARVRSYDDAGNRSTPLSASFATQPIDPTVFDPMKAPASRKVVFPGGTRVVPFGTQPTSAVPNAPSYENGKWWCDKHPLDERFWVADMTADLAEAGSIAVSVEAIVAGVTVLSLPAIQGTLIPVKLGGLDLTVGAVNYCTFRVTCANGEQLDRTIWFRPQQGKWELKKDPEDRRYYVADIKNDLVDSNTTATAATAIPVGVAELVAAQVQGSLIVVKLGGMDTSPDPTNYCTLRIDCANGERFYRTIHFNRVDN